MTKDSLNRCHRHSPIIIKLLAFEFKEDLSILKGAFLTFDKNHCPYDSREVGGAMTGSSSSSRGLPLVVSFLIFGLCWCVFISCPRSKAAYMCNVQCASNIDETLLFCCDLSDLPLSRSQAEGSNARDANQDSSIEDVTRVKPLLSIKCSKYKTLPEAQRTQKLTP